MSSKRHCRNQRTLTAVGKEIETPRDRPVTDTSLSTETIFFRIAVEQAYAEEVLHRRDNLGRGIDAFLSRIVNVFRACSVAFNLVTVM